MTAVLRGRWWIPSFSDWFFVALLAWLFLAGHGWSGLLADGDTGWHIRTGEYVLANGAPPRTDLFSFSREGEPWYAWEWLADVVFALAHRLGLKGVVLLAATAILVCLTLVFRHALWRGANVFIALAVCLLATGASGIHFLARPHVFTLLLLAVSLRLLDADRRVPTRAVWLLVPLTALWANLHAGFVALPVCLGLVAVGAMSRRYAGLCAACAAASLLNPYGWELHAHMARYLGSDWIRTAVDEFQSPKFRSESALHFEILLFAALFVAGSLFRRRRVADALLLVFWAHAALVSVRHVPVFAVVAAPILAGEASMLWTRWVAGRPRSSIAAIVDGLAQDFGRGAQRMSVLAPVLVAALLFIDAPLRWPRDFPEAKFPVRALARIGGARVFTTDQWGDYLLYRFYPRQRVFIDGRSDFYGPSIGRVYLKIAHGHPGWSEALDRWRFEYVLAPREWPLAGLLRQAGGWRVVDEVGPAVLFQKQRQPATITSSSTGRPSGRARTSSDVPVGTAGSRPARPARPIL